MKPVIAMPQMGESLFRKYMKSKYVQSLARAGAEVCWIELEDPVKASAQAARCAGLLLPGGADIEPSLYGQQRVDACGKPNALRDTAEPMILEAFMKTGKPVFAICRGLQLVNVCFGGTLKQDIKKEQQFRHMDFFSRAKSCHPVSVAEDSALYRMLGEAQLQVNSMHHQVVDKVGEGLQVSAKSADGYVEALEAPDYPFLLAVQWHPEHMSKRSETQQKLFDAFVKVCEK